MEEGSHSLKALDAIDLLPLWRNNPSIQVSMSANCDLLSRRGCSQKTMQTLLSDSSTIVPHPKSSSMKLRGSSRLIKAHMMSSSKIHGHLWSRPLAASLLSQLTSCSAKHAHARIRSHHYKEHQIMHAYMSMSMCMSMCLCVSRCVPGCMHACMHLCMMHVGM